MSETPYEPLNEALFLRLARENPDRLATYVASRALPMGLRVRAVVALVEEHAAEYLILPILEDAPPPVQRAAIEALRAQPSAVKARLAVLAESGAPESVREAARGALKPA